MSQNNAPDYIQAAAKVIWEDATPVPTVGGNSWLLKVTHLGEAAAVKVLRRTEDAKLARFKKEVDAGLRLSGLPNVAPILCSGKLHWLNERSGKVGTSLFFVMPWFTSNLRECLPNFQRADGGQYAVQVFLEIAKTVASIHTRLYAHRDLKPDNILVDEQGNTYIADFGLCLDLDLELHQNRLTKPGEIVGALAYRGPEFLRGRLDESDHTPGDVFSLGRILWAILCGEEPYGLTDLEFENTVIGDEVDRLHRPEYMQRIIRSATQVDPIKRVSMETLIAMTEDWTTDAGQKPSSHIVAALIENPRHQSFLESIKVAAQVVAEMRALLVLVDEELTTLYKSGGWDVIAEERKSNPVQVEQAPYSAHDHEGSFLHRDSPTDGRRIAFNMGDMQLFPMLVLSICFKFNPNQFDSQPWEVIAVHVPKWPEGEAEGATELKVFGTGQLDLCNGAAVNELSNCLRNAFRWLDNSLRTGKSST